MTPTEGFRHEALLYSNEDEFLDSTIAFIHDGISAGEPTLVVIDAERIAELQTELGPVADDVQFADMAAIGHNPARIIPAWHKFVTEHGATGRSLRGIGEPIDARRSAVELVECRHHEVLLNVAFADTPGFWLLCPYDTSALDPIVIRRSLSNHPFVCENDVHRSSPAYGAVDPPSLFREPLSDAPPRARRLTFGSLTRVRRFVSHFAAEVGLDPVALVDVLLAVDELASNSLQHGGGSGILSIWQDGASVICQVQDRGQITDALVGRREPAGGQLNGRGLWIVNQICDLLQVRTTTEATTIRAHLTATQNRQSDAVAMPSTGRQRT